MMESFCNLEDEPFPSFLSESQDSSCATLGNVTLGSTPGLPVAASTVSKIRAGVGMDNRVNVIEATYLEDRQLLRESSEYSTEEKGKFALSFKDDMDDADDFIAAHRFSDMMLKVQLDESEFRTEPFTLGPLSQTAYLPGQSSEPRTDLLDGLSQLGMKDRMNGKTTDPLVTMEKENLANDDIEGNNLNHDELQLYFNKVVPPAMQRGQVEGQEITAEDFQMPVVRLAATGMDSCPASDEEDTEDELEAAKRQRFTRSQLLPSTSRQLIGESNRPSFRPGLEGGSSDDECFSGWHTPSLSGIEYRRSAEGQVINSPVTGDGGDGDGSSGSEESGYDEIVSSIPLPVHTSVETTYDVLHGLGILGSGGVGEECDGLHSLPGLRHNGSPAHSEMGDRLGPVGTVEASSSAVGSVPQRISPVNRSMTLNRQVTLDAMDSTEYAPVAEIVLDSIYLRKGSTTSFHLPSNCSDEDYNGCEYDERVNEGNIDKPSLGMRGVPLGNCVINSSDNQSEEEDPISTSLESKYLSQSYQEHSEDVWNHCPDNVELEFQQGANASVVYQNEEGKWVTDLAYYSSFEKELDQNLIKKNVDQFQTEDFIPASNAIEKIIKDQEEFEKEHQFMQEEQMEVASCSPGQSDTSWKLRSSGQMSASQVSSKFETGNQSYLRLSLGEFFQQRSEALGCLGDNEKDGVKRPSFGYFITSPEKREPFALIRPSDFASRDSSVNDTVKLTDTDHTLNAEDLDKTLEATSDREYLKENADPEPCEKQQTFLAQHPEQSEVMVCGSPKPSCISPGYRSNLILSMSTIASAIDDASISSDPTQLAAMIMELSKKSCSNGRSNSKPKTGSGIEVPFSSLEIQNQAQRGQSDNSPGVDVFQKTTFVGEVSSFDMEKYLKKTELSEISDSETSKSPPGFEMLDWGAGSLHTSELSILPEKYKISSQREDQSNMVKVNDCVCNESTVLNYSQKTSRKSFIPPSSILTASTNPGQGSVVSRQSFTDNSVSDGKVEKGGVKLGKVSNSPAVGDPPQRVKSLVGPLGPRTPLGCKEEHSMLPCLNGCKSPSHKQESTRHLVRPNSIVERRFSEGSRSSRAPHNHSATEKYVGFDCHSLRPSQSTPEEFQGLVVQASASVEENQCSFRPSTSPLTHSSPSQTSFTSADGIGLSPPSSVQVTDRLTCELSPQTTCSSLSRLTYISLNDSTCLPTPDRHKSNGTMPLSTTIIRASPTPAEEQEAQMVQNPLAKQPSDTCGLPKTLNPVCQSKCTGTHYNNCKSPDLQSCLVLGCMHSQSECNLHNNNLGSGYNQHNCPTKPSLCQLSKVDSGYSSNLNIQQPLSMMSQPSQQWTGISAQTSEAIPVGGFGLPFSYSLNDLRHIPISSLQPQGAVVDFSHGGMSTLFTGRTLFSSQLAQQYLGSERLLQPGSYHIGLDSGLYRVSSAGIPSVEAAVRHHPQGQLDPAFHGKPYSQHRVGPWSSGDVPEFRDQVVIPEELRFPQACCVGIASQTTLSLFNPSERWQQVSISLTSLSIDGEMVYSLPYQLLIVKNKTIIGPKSTEEQKIQFIPPKAGIYQFVLSVSSCPATSDADAAKRTEVFSKKLLLIAMAEDPTLEIDVGKSGGLDFGDLAGGSAKALPLKLLNRTHANLPIRLVISANATAWRCFTFSKSPVTKTEELLPASQVTPLSAPSLINHVMHAGYEENPDSFMVWVHFQAPQKYASCTGELGPPDDYNARVDIEVDCPGKSHLIRSIPLSARSGTARVHAPKDLQTVYLSASFGKFNQQTLPLKNAGNIDVQLKLKSSDGENFSVKPEDLFLRTGEEQGIVISFSAKGSLKFRESVLTILVLPSGPQYEVILKGDVVPEGDAGKIAPALTSVSMGPGVVPPILSNKQFIAWGGVTLGRAMQQKLVLRNNSPHTTHQLRLLIRGQDQDCFQLQSMFGSEERLTRHRELSIRPGEDIAVHLLFAPTRVACMLAKLEIKQSGVRPSHPGVKFTIPLSGYGGTSNIILEDLPKTSNGYEATLGGVLAGNVSKMCVCVRNTGSRAAYIKAVAYSDLQKCLTIEPTIISLSPSEFVLKERTQEVITVQMKSTQKEQAKCHSVNGLLATICLFCGDELSRRQFRRLLLNKPKAGWDVLSENSLLKSLNFDEKFLGEALVLENDDLPQRPNEVQIFYKNMSKVVLLLLGSSETSDSKSGSFGTSDRHISNVSLDVLPVKGPQGMALRVVEPFLKQPHQKEPSDQQESWSIHPEQLILTTPTPNGASNTRQVQIQNHLSRELNFELSWPAHCLTITPQHGVIEPKCHLQIMISPNNSLATKSAMLPWSGQVYVQCDNQQKVIKVQIRPDLALDVSIVPGDRCLSTLPPQTATPLTDLVKPQTNLLEIINRTIIFPTTASAATSESSLEVENGDQEVRWYLSSFAPPYVKGVDTSGDVYRATYTVFRCSRVSGTLGPREKMQVPVTFMPRDQGDYAQFWDLECHSVTDPQQKTRNRFQFCGTGVKAGPVKGPQEGDCSLIRTNVIVKTRRRTDLSIVKIGQEESLKRGVYGPQDKYIFPATQVGESSTIKVNLRNNSFDTHELRFIHPKEPFHIKHTKYSLRSQHYINLPVQFKPGSAGKHVSVLLIQSETSGTLSIHLTGEAVP